MIFQNQENVSLANNETARATQIANKITMVQGLISNISQATNATGIQSVVLTFMQGQISDSAAIPVLDKNTCERRLNILIFRNNFISLSTFPEYESIGMF
jgi:division protein CdvB (Snf7/Vps24/ESCRT-III family)